MTGPPLIDTGEGFVQLASREPQTRTAIGIANTIDFDAGSGRLAILST